MSDASSTEAGLRNLWVPGVPRPKGSLRPVGNRYGRGAVRMVEQVAGSTDWLHTVQNAVQRAIRVRCGSVEAPCPHSALRGEDCPEWRLPHWLPWQEPIDVIALFVFERPARDLSSAPVVRTFGDLDKLCRNVGDALEKAGLIKDDALIASWSATKLWRGDPAVFGAPIGGGVRLNVTPWI